MGAKKKEEEEEALRVFGWKVIRLIYGHYLSMANGELDQIGKSTKYQKENEYLVKPVKSMRIRWLGYKGRIQEECQNFYSMEVL